MVIILITSVEQPLPMLKKKELEGFVSKNKAEDCQEVPKEPLQDSYKEKADSTELSSGSPRAEVAEETKEKFKKKSSANAEDTVEEKVIEEETFDSPEVYSKGTNKNPELSQSNKKVIQIKKIET